VSYSLNALYSVVGISKQAVRQMEHRAADFKSKMLTLLMEVDDLRAEHPGCGVEKMYYTLKPDFIGRDRFIDVMMQMGYRLKRTPNYHRTTYPGHLCYPNMIMGRVLNGPSQVWQSDLTYVQVGAYFCYAVFILDVYTRVIVGYSVADHMRATANMHALKMALRKYDPPEIHHSDRGSQYTSKDYIQLLKDNKSSISMGLIAQENAYAERINRTIKEEYVDPRKPKSLKELDRIVLRAVEHYNTSRLHQSLNRKTPKNFYDEVLTLPQSDRPSMTIYQEGVSEISV
jgi:putative transposase